jgi:hypothetical protein
MNPQIFANKRSSTRNAGAGKPSGLNENNDGVSNAMGNSSKPSHQRGGSVQNSLSRTF